MLYRVILYFGFVLCTCFCQYFIQKQLEVWFLSSISFSFNHFYQISCTLSDMPTYKKLIWIPRSTCLQHFLFWCQVSSKIMFSITPEDGIFGNLILQEYKMYLLEQLLGKLEQNFLCGFLICWILFYPISSQWYFCV